MQAIPFQESMNGIVTMSREEALQQLQEIRQEILAIYTEMDACRQIQEGVEKLQKEKECPAKVSLTLQPENTADRLKLRFEQENQQRAANNRTPARIIQSVNAAVLVIVCVVLGVDIFGHKGIVIPPDVLPKLDELTTAGEAMLFGAHALLSLAGVLIPLLGTRRRYGRKWPIIGAVVTFITLCCYAVMIGMVKAELYAWLMLGSIALTLAALGLLKLLRKRAAKAPMLTKEQKREWEEARRADEQAKAVNVRAREEAESRSKAAWEQRQPEIDRELRQQAEAFNRSRERIDAHMKRLETMDALCEDDKNLQTVELLIRFIKTRRADSVKEALQEYDKLMANRQLMKIEQQKVQAELRRTAQEHADRMQQLEAERRHRSEMEYLARDSAQSRAKIAGQLRSIGDMIYYDLHA